MVMATETRQSITEWIAGGAAAICVGIGIWAGDIKAQAEHHVDASDFARVQQQVEGLSDDTQEIKEDIKDLESGQREVLRLLREIAADQSRS